MSFAQTSNGHQSPFLSEKDLLRQIASNYTKEAIAAHNKLDDQSVGQAKLIMKDHLTRVTKVWQSFAKFVQS